MFARRQGLFVAIVALVIAVQAVVIVERRAEHLGDFDISRELGRRFLAGEPLYAGGLHYPYMPAAAMYFAPLALLPPGVGLALRYLAALACLGLTLRLLDAMVRAADRHLAAPTTPAAMTLVLAAHYIVRDLDDGGPHLILLAILVGGIFSAARQRLLAAAACFGLAAALKAPNALLLAFLLWKRQWRLAAFSAAALLVWVALPSLWMGPADWWRHQQEWLRTAAASAAGAAQGGAAESESRVQNQALRPQVARAIGAPWGNAAGVLAGLALLGVVAWWSRSGAGDAADWPAQASAVMILSLLLSPVTWVQHLVLLVPALYLIVARGAPAWTPAARAALALYAICALLLNRELLGRELYLVLLAHGLHTAAMLLVLALLLRAAAPSGRTAAPCAG